MPRIGLLATGAACCFVTIGFLNWYLEHQEQLAWKKEIVEKIVPTEEPTVSEVTEPPVVGDCGPIAAEEKAETPPVAEPEPPAAIEEITEEPAPSPPIGDDILVSSLQLGENCPLAPCLTEDAGRGFVATRAIKAGETVLRAKVAVTAPCWPCESSSLSTAELAVCAIDPGAGASFLSGVARDEATTWLAGELQSLWLLTIRAALLSRDDPSTWSALRCLEHHNEDRTEVCHAMLTTAASRLSKALHTGASLPMPAEHVAQLIGALLTNAFGTRPSGQERTKRLDIRAYAFAVSLSASLFNHSCVPNARTSFRISVDDGTLVFTSARAIQAGEACTIAYTATEEPTYIRRQLLNRTKHFICRCVKCRDPLECDTYSSCLRCTNCVSGWQLPVLSPPTCHLADLRSLQSDEEGEEEDDDEEVEEMEWVCGVCGYTTPLEEVIQWDEELRERLASCLDEENVFGEEVLRKLMSDALERCHPNHAILLQARLALSACTLGDVNTSDGSKRLASRIVAAEEALALASRLLPLADPQKADLHFQIGVSRHRMAQLYLKKVSRGGHGEREAKLAAADEIRAAAGSMLRSAAEFEECGDEGQAGSGRAAMEFAQVAMQQLASLG